MNVSLNSPVAKSTKTKESWDRKRRIDEQLNTAALVLMGIRLNSLNSLLEWIWILLGSSRGTFRTRETSVKHDPNLQSSKDTCRGLQKKETTVKSSCWHVTLNRWRQSLGSILKRILLYQIREYHSPIRRKARLRRSLQNRKSWKRLQGGRPSRSLPLNFPNRFCGDMLWFHHLHILQRWWRWIPQFKYEFESKTSKRVL